MASSIPTDAVSTDDPTALQLEDVMAALSSLSRDLNSTNKALMASKIDQESMGRQVAALVAASNATDNRRTTFAAANHNRAKTNPAGAWRPPPSRTTAQGLMNKSSPRIRVEAPRFNGDDSTGWIFRIQIYFDYFLTSESDRLSLVAMLFDHPASEWFCYYQNNTCTGSGEDFLVAVRQRFYPDYYANYVGLLAKLRQSSLVLAYQTEFETLLNKISNVDEPTLLTMYVAGLKQPLQREINLRHPHSLQEAFALACELAACHADLVPSYNTNTSRPWSTREAHPPASHTATQAPTQQPRPSAPSGNNYSRPQSNPHSSLPIVRVSSAEKTERSRKGLCWYCDERWAPATFANISSLPSWVMMRTTPPRILRQTLTHPLHAILLSFKAMYPAFMP